MIAGDSSPEVVVDGLNKRAFMQFSQIAGRYFTALNDASSIRLLVPQLLHLATKQFLTWMSQKWNRTESIENWTFAPIKHFTQTVEIYTAALLLKVPWCIQLQIEADLRHALLTRDLTTKEVMVLEQLFANRNTYDYTDGYGWDGFHELIVTGFAHRLRSARANDMATLTQADRDLAYAITLCPTLKEAIDVVLMGELVPKSPNHGAVHNVPINGWVLDETMAEKIEDWMDYNNSVHTAERSPLDLMTQIANHNLRDEDRSNGESAGGMESSPGELDEPFVGWFKV